MINRAREALESQLNLSPKITRPIPRPAPPYATKSIIVVDASCITKTFMVIFLNSSAL